jgi:NADPH2:quinone reductase
MRALQIAALDGPDALRLADLPEPERHPLFGEPGVVIEVHAAGVAFPDVLLSRGRYQVKPDLPFVPGQEVAGVVRAAPDDAPVRPGDKVVAATAIGGFAEVAIAPGFLTFPLPSTLDYAEGAGLVLNYHTAYFSLVTRGRLRAGEWVLVHGAAGGVGTATLQVAKALGARTIGVVSSDEKERVARAAGADEVVRSDGEWRAQARELTGGQGVDVVVDPVGGKDRFTDSLRALAVGGRAVVVGFTEGSIPEVRVNRLLLNNVDVVGAGWGAYVFPRPEAEREIGDAVTQLAEEGKVKPLVGARFPLERGADALRLIDERGALGKFVLDVR